MRRSTKAITMQRRYWISHVLLLKILLITFAAAREKGECPFSPGFHRYSDDSSNGTTEQFCAKLFFGKETWNFSSSYCKLHYSSLTHKIGFNSSLRKEWIHRGFSSDEFLWVGIRRRAGYYVIESTGELFREINSSPSENWGAQWSAEDFRNLDCVALNPSNGSLVTRNCNLRFYQICDDRDITHPDKLPKAPSCPNDNWDIPYYLLGTGRKCISTFKPQSQENALKTCESNNARLATAEEYDILSSGNASLFDSATAYWADPENNGSCALKSFQAVSESKNDRPENCSKPLPFTCVKELENREFEVWISPSRFQSFPSTSTCAANPDLFICNVKINGSQVTEKKKEFLYQWYKDDIPINAKANDFRMSSFGDSMKRDPNITDIATRQGSYHCEFRIVGSAKSHSSPKLDFFYSDIATYILSIDGNLPHSYRGYSDHDFLAYMKSLETEVMAKRMAKIKSRYRNATWDFQSIRAYNNTATVKLVLYIYRNDNKELKDRFSTYQEVKTIFENSADNETISFSVSSADICFGKEAGDTCEGKIMWPTSKETISVNTENICLDMNKRLVQRGCKASIMTKAEWSEFNCSSCQYIKPRVKNLDILCSEGYTKFVNTDLCFKIHNEKETWHDADRICSESSSYLLNEAHHDIGFNYSFWLSYKYSHGKFQQIGMKLRNSKLGAVSESMSPDSHCLAAVLKKNSSAPIPENCNKKFPFVCVQDPFEVVSSVKFSNTWRKLPTQKSCYYFAKEDAYDWQQAEKECQLMIPKADFPVEILQLEPYRYFKMLMHKLFKPECQSTWWMNLTYNAKEAEFIKTNAEYVDWDPYTNFHLEESYGAITLFPNEEISWILRKPTKKYKYICEIKDCQDTRPTQAYIEDRSKNSLQNLTEIPEDLFRNFSLKCVPSGWFLTRSISWYKDGILLNISSDLLSFTHYPSLSIQDLLQHQGYYWCSVDQLKPRRTIYSSKVLFKFPGIYTYVLSMKSQSSILLEACNTFMFSEISDLPDQITTLNKCFKNSLDALNIYHLTVRNLTCDRSRTDITAHIYFKNDNMDEKDILKRIQNANFIELLEKCDVELGSISARSTVSCYGNTTVLKNRNLTWPTTLIGENAFPEELCLNVERKCVVRKCLGDFSTGAVWEPISISECSSAESSVTKKLYPLLRDNKNVTLSSAVMLQSLISSAEKLVPADVQFASEILMKYAKSTSLESQILNPVVETISKLMDVPEDVMKESGNSSSQIIESFENFASIVVKNESIEIATTNIAVSIHRMNLTSTPNCILFSDWSKNLTTLFDVPLEKFQDNINNSRAGIFIPPSLMAEYRNKSDRVIYQIRKNLNYVENFTVVSAVIQASFNDISEQEIHPPVKMVFKLLEEFKEANQSSVRCVFWDQRLNNNFGSWSYKGCLVNEWNSDSITCSCNHLTSFAVVLDSDPSCILRIHKEALSYITFIGCSLSCFGLSVIILTFICFKQWRKSIKNKALFNLSVCLVSFLVLFMAGIDKTQLGKACLVISITLHYLLLASFLWMLVSAFIMYLKLVKVLDVYIPRFIQKAMLFAYGVPAVIVIFILSYRYQFYYQDKDKYCWLSQEVFYYAIAMPLLTVLLVNFIFFGLILYANTCRKPSPNPNRNRNIALAKALFYISILLGLSWIFGFLAVGRAKLVFQYLFAITTTLQGFCFFLHFIVKEKSAYGLWRKAIFHLSVSEKTHVSHISDSVSYSNRVFKRSQSSAENLIRNDI